MNNTRVSLNLFIPVLLFIAQFSNASAQYQSSKTIEKTIVCDCFGLRIANNCSTTPSSHFLSNELRQGKGVLKEERNLVSDDFANKNNISLEVVNPFDEFIDGYTSFTHSQDDDADFYLIKSEKSEDVYETILSHD
jgi:hypothetical protein